MANPHRNYRAGAARPSRGSLQVMAFARDEEEAYAIFKQHRQARLTSGEDHRSRQSQKAKREAHLALKKF